MATAQRKEPHPVEYLSGTDMRRVLQVCGYSMTEFAAFLDRTHTYVVRDLQRMRAIPWADLEGLIRMVTVANFDEAVRRITGHTPRKYLRGSEMRQIMERSRVRAKEFAADIHKSYYFVNTTLFCSQDIPLRYIDNLILYIGLDNYIRHLKNIRQV